MPGLVQVEWLGHVYATSYSVSSLCLVIGILPVLLVQLVDSAIVLVAVAFSVSVTWMGLSLIAHLSLHCVNTHSLSLAIWSFGSHCSAVLVVV